MGEAKKNTFSTLNCAVKTPSHTHHAHTTEFILAESIQPLSSEDDITTMLCVFVSIFFLFFLLYSYFARWTIFHAMCMYWNDSKCYRLYCVRIYLDWSFAISERMCAGSHSVVCMCLHTGLFCLGSSPNLLHKDTYVMIWLGTYPVQLILNVSILFQNWKPVRIVEY